MRDAYYFGSMDALLPALAGNSHITAAIVYPSSGFILLWDFRRRRKIPCIRSNPGFSVYYRRSPLYYIISHVLIAEFTRLFPLAVSDL